MGKFEKEYAHDVGAHYRFEHTSSERLGNHIYICETVLIGMGQSRRQISAKRHHATTKQLYTHLPGIS